MKIKTALLLVIVLLFGMFFETNAVPVNAAEEEQEITDQYNSASLLAQYSTSEIIELYPDFCDYLASELRALNTDILVRDYNFTKNNIGAVYFSVLIENPDIFYIFSTRFQITANYDTGIIQSIRPEYYFDIEDIPSKITEFNQKTDYILSGLNSGWNDVTKARYLHDMLAYYAEYDTKYEVINDSDYNIFRMQMRIYSAYGALVDNNAVCEGYAMAYKYLLSKVGIESHYLQNIDKRHAWNIVKIGDKFYHVDITDDDLTYDTLGRVGHDSFLKSDSYFLNDKNTDHNDWVTHVKADSTMFDNAWWNNVNTVIYRHSGYDYYINQNYTGSVYAALTRRNISTGAEEILTVVKTRWYLKDIENAFWERAFSHLAGDGQYFYYNDTNSVYRMKIGETTSKKIYTKPSDNPNDIYGLAFRMNGELYVTIKENPYVKDVFYKLNVQAQPIEPTGFTESATQDITDSSQPTQYTEPSATQNTTASGTVTQPTSASQNQSTPQYTEPITAATAKPAKADPIVIRRTISLYIKRTSRITLSPKGVYKYSSSDKNKASVTSSGLIKAKKAGKAVITAKSSSVIFKITINIKNPRLNVKKITIKRKKSFKLKIIGGSGEIIIKPSNKKIKINSKGKVTGVHKGKSTITVRVCGLKLKCRVTVK